MADPDLADLSAFMRVADAGGFRAAAQRRGVSASSLSYAVQRLEQAMGLRLFNRTTRSVVPTDAGQQLLDRLRPAMADIASAYDGAMRDAEPGGTLKLDVPGVVARHILPPIAAAFLTAHPRIRLEISVTEGLVDVMAAGCVAGIRYDEHIAADMVAVPIGPGRQRFVGVASPAYLAACGSPRHPTDLANHTCIAHVFPNGRVEAWQFERDGERIKVRPQGRLATGSSDIQVAAAVAGHGILFTFEEFVADPVTRGDLVTLLDAWPLEFDGPRIYYPRAHRRDPALAAFVRFVKGPGRSLSSRSSPPAA